jgi:hypothetical protein
LTGPVAVCTTGVGTDVPDVLAYLTSWDVLSPDPNEEQQASLFGTSTDRLDARKLQTIREILELIKQVEVIEA